MLIIYIVSQEKYTAEQGIAPVALGITTFSKLSLAPVPMSDYYVQLYTRSDPFLCVTDKRTPRPMLAKV